MPDLRKFSLFLILLMLCIPGAMLMANDAREANAAYENGEYEKAEELFRAALEQNPEDVRLYFNLGNTLARQGEMEEAIQFYMDYRGRVTEPGKKALAEYNIGKMLADGEKWKPAASHFRNSLILNPQDADARYNYELAVKKAEEEEEQNQQQQQQNQDRPEPSEYAKAMKKQAEELVAQRQYTRAHNLMQQALKADETVQAFSDFIERIKNVSDINTNY